MIRKVKCTKCGYETFNVIKFRFCLRCGGRLKTIIKKENKNG